jgi:hypothetical protein
LANRHNFRANLEATQRRVAAALTPYAVGDNVRERDTGKVYRLVSVTISLLYGESLWIAFDGYPIKRDGTSSGTGKRFIGADDSRWERITPPLAGEE